MKERLPEYINHTGYINPHEKIDAIKKEEAKITEKEAHNTSESYQELIKEIELLNLKIKSIEKEIALKNTTISVILELINFIYKHDNSADIEDLLPPKDKSNIGNILYEDDINHLMHKIRDEKLRKLVKNIYFNDNMSDRTKIKNLLAFYNKIDNDYITLKENREKLKTDRFLLTKKN